MITTCRVPGAWSSGRSATGSAVEVVRRGIESTNMKFMVMCALDRVGELPSDERIEAGLASLGLQPVGSSRSHDGLNFGLPGAFVGEFRAHEAATLESLLREQIVGLLAGSGNKFRLCLIPTASSPAVRKQA